MREIEASEFKANCLVILDEVERTGEEVVILKRGRPVARVVPPALGQEKYPQQSLEGTVKILGDIVGPVLPAEDWEAEGGSKRRESARGASRSSYSYPCPRLNT